MVNDKHFSNIPKQEWHFFPSPSTSVSMLEKRSRLHHEKLDLSANSMSCGSPSHNNIYHSHLTSNLYSLQENSLLHDSTTSTSRNCTLPSPTIYPTPPPSASWYGHWFSDTF